MSESLCAPRFSLFPMKNPKFYLGFQVSYHCTQNLYMITIAVQIQLQHSQAPKWRPSSILAEAAKNWLKSCLGGVWGKGLPLPANPDNVTSGGATDAWCREGGSWREEGGDMK
jgi:hypothetical protein